MITLHDVTTAVDSVTAEQPDRVDARVGRDLAPRYVEHGRPCCLVAEVLTRLGVRIGVLKDLDVESGPGGGGVRLHLSRHPMLKRFDPVALELLAEVQHQQDLGRSWREVADVLLKPQPRWPGDKVPEYPWL